MAYARTAYHRAMKRSLDPLGRVVVVLIAVTLGACGGGARATEETTPRARPPTEAPVARNEGDTTQLVQRFADALRAYAVRGAQDALDPVLVERVAWRVVLTSFLAMALDGIDPQQREAMAAEWSDELARAGTEELARAYVSERWARHAQGGDCTVTRVALPDEPIFPSTAGFAADLRARLDADLVRAAELTALYEVTCGAESFGVAVLRDGPELVPMM